MRANLQRGSSQSQPFYFEIQVTGSYEPLAASETYARKDDAVRAINLIRTAAAGATVVENT